MSSTRSVRERLLEREAELRAIEAVLASANSREGRLLLIEGPAGTGKTALLTAAQEQAAARGQEVLSARSSELERAHAFGVAIQLFEPLLARTVANERRELLAGAAALTRRLFEGAVRSSFPQENRLFSMLHGLYWLVANLAEGRPLLLAIDDAHWSDLPSLRFLLYLAQRLAELPVAVIAAVRSGEPDVPENLLRQLADDPSPAMLRPEPLSAEGVETLVRRRLDAAESPFVRACASASGGNPYLLTELLGDIERRGLEPNAEMASQVSELAPESVLRAALLRLARLPAGSQELAQAVAVLGDGALVRRAGPLAGLDDAATPIAVDSLAAAGILRHGEPLSYVHPLLRSAIYADVPPAQRSSAHLAAARLLDSEGEPVEGVAAHLLRASKRADPWVVSRLREAAARALDRGAPELAVSHLERALEEPPIGEERGEVLLELGSAERRVEGPRALEHLRHAREALAEPGRRAAASYALARAAAFDARPQEAVGVGIKALEELGDTRPDIAQRIEAVLLWTAIGEQDLKGLADELCDRVRQRPADERLGAKMLEALVAYRDARAGARDAVARAEAALAGGLLMSNDNGGGPFLCATSVLAAADSQLAVSLYDAALAKAREDGSLYAYGATKIFRSYAYLLQGRIREALADAHDGRDAERSYGIPVGTPYVVSHLADALMEQGDLTAAAAAIEEAGLMGALPENAHYRQVLQSRARLRLLQGELRRGLEETLECGRHFEAVGGRNPAFLAWRSQAALALVELGEDRGEARRLAAEELELARAWRAPRALGSALRAAGLVEGGEHGLELLREAAEILEGSPARLELARALTDLGAALRRANCRSEAREPLRKGLELAHTCGARSLEGRARTELLATGARPRRVVRSGVDALTVSERRVAEMAAEGKTNREIAQALFVTLKTVEVHLSHAYQKLDIDSRTRLWDVLSEAAPSEITAIA